MALRARSLPSLTDKEVAALFSRARPVLRHNVCTILVAPSNQDYGHLIVVTSRKVGNAPERNRIRRRIKAIFHTNNLYASGYDCIIITRPACVALSYQELQELILTTFQRLQRKQ